MKHIQRILLGLFLSAGSVALYAQPSWTVDVYKYQTTMSITAQLNIEGDFSTAADDMIAVFCGDECRGVASNNYTLNGKNYAALTVYGNNNDELLTLKIYIASSGKTIDLKQYFHFAKDSIMGTYDAPIVFYSDLSHKKLVAYNFISPNGDGKNDAFKVDDLIAVSGMTFEVRNRQGVVVFQQKDYDNLWTGVDKNDNDLPQGVYYYLFTNEEGEVIYKGSVTLVR